MNQRKYSLLLMLCISSMLVGAQQIMKYKDPAISTEERTQDLLSRMTLKEKIGQLRCPLGWEIYDKQGDHVTYSSKYKKYIDEEYIGMFWAVYRADPWTKKTLENGLNPEMAARAGNEIQKYAMEKTRLGIPVFFAEEAPHGHMAIGATVFPAGIGVASTWNPELVEKMGEAIAKEIRVQGGHISYGPVLDLSREPRWSRVEEAYGEDPVLTANIGAAYVKGTGGGDLSKPYSTIATLKHFIAYGIPEGGHNGNTAFVGNRELHENFLPPFKAAIDAGALSVMTAYNSIDGIPCTSNSYLLTDVLRNDWGFNGFVVSDLVSIDGIMGSHRVAGSLREAGTMAMRAGVDVDLGGNPYRLLEEALQKGEIAGAMIDTAVARVLRLKFDMGLFENPYTDPQSAREEVRSGKHVNLALQTARESIVLLENKNGTLPLNKNLKKIAVIGPNADNIYNQLGDYTAPQDEKHIQTVLKGIQGRVSAETAVEYVKGCAIRDTTIVAIEEAAQAARSADVAVVVVGGSSARDFKTKYLETGAAIASDDVISDMESGEGYDRASLALLGKQAELLQAIKATGTPMIVIYIQGRPLDMNWASEQADALLTAWYPGQEGGTAVADILFGDYNPSGRLPISIPRNVGQLPVYYNKKAPRGHDYVEMTAAPLYPFGYGLSYTDFEYSDLLVTKQGGNRVEVAFTLKNKGKYDGEEVVQLYVRDEIASVVQPLKQLKQFRKVSLKAGEEQMISFVLTDNDFALINRNMEWEVEPGDFTLLVGQSSDNVRLMEKITLGK